MIRQEQSDAHVRRREGIKLGGLITAAAGIGIMSISVPDGKRRAGMACGINTLACRCRAVFLRHVSSPQKIAARNEKETDWKKKE